MVVGQGFSSTQQHLIKQLLPDADQKLPTSNVNGQDFSAAVDKLSHKDQQRVKLVSDLSDVSNGDEALVRAIASNPEVKSLREVALQYNAADLAALPITSATDHKAGDVSESSTAAGGKPAGSTGKLVADAAHGAATSHSTLGAAAANDVLKKLFAKVPVAVLQKLTEDKQLFGDHEETRNGVLSFFKAHPDFDIRHQSVAPLLTNTSAGIPKAGQGGALSKSTSDAVKTLQRVQALTPDPAAVPALLSAGVQSAQQVAAAPQSQFVSRIALPEATARDIHRHATNSVIRSNMTLTTALQTVRGTGIRAIDGPTTRKERIQAAKQLMVTSGPAQRSIVNLEQLFGSMDYCDCSDCTSVISPANYFVELLQFLRNNNLGGDNGNSPVPQTNGWTGTALEKLFRRRPDLADLELTCANTNTVLPYIDLSNEVMESFVVHLSSYINNTEVPKQATIEVFNMADDDDSAQLLAQPRHVSYRAYCILKDAKYPFTLPYNEPIDEARILLGLLNTSRYELMSTFRQAPQPGTPDSPDNEIAGNRAITAEYLLLTQEDYKILTLEAFYSKAYFENVLHRPDMSDATYQRNIGILHPYAYWGYHEANANDMTNTDETKQVGLTFVKAQFLPRSGIAYTDLVTLVQTQYVNPNWPKGWALTMLEKIRYSYAYLQSLIDHTKTKKQEQLAPVIQWLAKWQPVAELFEKMRQQYLHNVSGASAAEGDGLYGQTEGHGANTDDCCCECCNYCIWKCWVLRYFELFGKLVVLDSRDGAVFGAEGWLVLQKLPPPPITIQLRRPPASKPTAPATPPKSQALKAIPATGASTSSLPALTPPSFGSSGSLAASSTSEEVDTVIGYLARDGSITTTSDTGVVTQIGHVAPDCTLIYDSNGYTFVQQYALDGTTYAMELLPVDQTLPAIGVVDITTDKLELYQVGTDGTIDQSVTTVVQWGPIQDSCNLDLVRLVHLDSSPISAHAYGRWQRFMRLWLKLGWTMNQLDQALIGLAGIPSPLESSSPTQGGGTVQPTTPAVTWADLQDRCSSSTGETDCGDGDNCGGDKCCGCPIHTGDLWTPPAPLNITPGFLDQLAAVQELQKITGLDVSQLLVFWADIGTHSDAMPSLYQQLFLSTSMLALDPIFEADTNGNYLTTNATLSAHAPAVMAALRIYKPTDLATLVSVAKITNDLLTLDNVSALFRYKLLANVLAIQIAQLPAFMSVFDGPFSSGAIGTLQLVKDWTNVSNAGFTLSQLRYVVTGNDDPTRPLGPSELSILKTCKALADGLSNILTSYPDPSPGIPVTADMVASAAGLIFDSTTTAAIQRVLNGSTTWTTYAPTGLNLTIPDSLSKVLAYVDSPATITSVASASVTSTGILTTDEVSAAKALVSGANAAAWGQAIDRLLKQTVTWFNNTLAGVFSDPNGAMAVLLAGDVPATTPASPDPSDPTVPPPAPDPGTAPGKMLYFLTNFMPFLRATLEQQLVTDTMTSVSGLSTDLTQLLLNNILMVESSTGNANKISAMSALMGLLNEPPQTPTTSWTGYLVAPSTDGYTFIAGGDTQPASILLNGASIPFSHEQTDPVHQWSSDPVKLTAGSLQTLTNPSGPPTQLKWQTIRVPASSIPSSALLPGYATDAMSAAFTALTKAGIVISGFNLSTDEVSYFQENKADFNGLDFNAITLLAWKRMSAYVNLRQSLQGANASLLVLFQWAVANSTSSSTVDVATLVDMIVDSTAWDPVPVASMIDTARFNLATPSAYRNEIALTKISEALTVFTNVGGGGGSSGAIDVPTLFAWAQPLAKFEVCWAVAAAIRKTIRSRYDVTTWEQAVQPLNNTLREDKKNALIAYLLVQDVLRSEGIVDADSLFDFFLIDVQMSSCLQTSRIKQAISTVQVFIQRCLLGLELDENGIPISVDAGRWNWMSKFVLWQANRKVFLYPENWLVPSLRDDKSTFYTGMESSLMQKSVDSNAVTSAFKDYFYNVDLAANLLVRGLFLDTSTQTSVLHIVSSSRHTPPEFYYRQLQFQTSPATQTWQPWEVMSVDIPSYTVEATTGSSSSAQGTVTSTGSYVTPVVWNGRIFVLYPTFAKKTLPSTATSDTKTTMSDLGNQPPNHTTPAEYWYITMNISERRDGQWSPKQVSTEGVYEDISTIADPKTPQPLPSVNSYAFVPRCVGSGDSSTLSVDVMRQSGAAFVAVGRFDFVNGRIVRSTTTPATLTVSGQLDFGANIVADVTSQQSGATTYQMGSWQATSATGSPDYYLAVPYAYYPMGLSSGVVQLAWEAGQAPESSGSSGTSGTLPMTNFYHGFVHNILARLSTTGLLSDVFSYYQHLDSSQFSDAYGGNPQTIYSELAQPYALYNWEPSLHALMELATQMNAQSQFDQALALCQYIFNPLVSSNVTSDCWLFPPFKSIIAKDYLENFFNSLQPGQPDFSITQWRNHPFAPYVVARSRPVTFMKAVVMLYIQILIAYGDSYFRQNTLETVPLAIQCYAIASHIYGLPGQKIPKRGTTEALTYRTLSDRFDAFDDAVVDLELMFPFSNQIDTAYPVGFTGQLDTPVNLPNIFGSATTRYFCIPQNDQLLQLRATIDDRLYKLRHCQDINGNVQKLPLFEPPLDVGALVAATASGLSLSSFLNDLDSPMPNYRFYYLLQKAHEVVAELKALIQGWLSIKERGDMEALGLLRQQHELQINQLTLEIKNRTLDEANAVLTQLGANADMSKYRLGYYLNLLGMNESIIPQDPTQSFSEIDNQFDTPANDGGLMLIPSEAEQMDKAGTARDINVVAGVHEAISSIFMALPSTHVDGKPLGVGATAVWGFPNLGNAAAGTSRALKVGVDYLTAQSALAGLRSSYLKQRQERIQQANNAGYELNNVYQQMATQNARIDIATKDVSMQQTQIDNSQEVLTFLQSKYTNQQLYTWLDQQTQILGYSAYTLAYDLAKRVEKAYQFERPRDTQVYIQYGYWDQAHNGLLAGERLSSALRQIEAAYQSNRGYDYEIVKNVSLRLTQPVQLLTLRQTGSCQFELPEILFDMDFPGHYLRRIKSVSLTLPCVTGPYTSVSCTLRLTSHTFRTSPVAKGASDYPQTTDSPDNRFATTNIPISAIATSNCQSDAGVFDLDFRGSERYLPFEGAGAISTWSLQLPDAFRQFDYSTIADAVMTVRYTSVDGGDQLKSAAGAALAAFVKNAENLAATEGLFMLWDLKAEFATDFYRITNPLPSGSDPTQRYMTLQSLGQTFPVFTAGAKKITAVDIFLVSTTPLPVSALSVAPVTTTPSGISVGEGVPFTPGASIRSLSFYQSLGADLQVGTWQVAIADATVTLDRIWLVVRYQLG